MSTQTVYFAVDLTIHEGKLSAFETIAQAMIAGCRKEAGALGYEWFFSSDRRRCRLIEIYKDADAVLEHVTGPVVQQLVPKLLEASSINGFEVYGDPGPEAAETLRGIGAEIFGFQYGLGG